MSEELHHALRRRIVEAVRERYGAVIDEPPLETPPDPSLGDVALPVAFDLARVARKAPRRIAEELAPSLEALAGIARVEVAGPGYLNVFFDRRAYLLGLVDAPAPEPVIGEKIIVEHTNINPNKAAHIGHLRNAALGDTFVRVLRHLGEAVEIQNYIDDTGVQVADVVVGLLDLEGKDVEGVRVLAERERFDDYCWDLYARVAEFYEADPARVRRREETLQAIEAGRDPEAAVARLVATRIVHRHLETMDRIDVRYDLLPWEGDILRLRFWERAFELLKERGAVRLATSGKNAGCWVMDLPEEGEAQEGAENEKVIVRSNGTVTYVGKDIAYQLWKLGLLDRDFYYRVFHRYPDGAVVWSTSSEPPAEAEPPPPSFGRGGRVYNVIDARQAYLQRIVQQGVALVASEEARRRSRHFSYEMVALTPATCRELGFPVSDEDATKPYLEVSGRKGLGVKANDLIDALASRALAEVTSRNPELDETERRALAGAIARGALRYFMVKYTKNRVLAFDFAEALNFDGDSGPYLQYAMVRANKILQKMGLSTELGPLAAPAVLVEGPGLDALAPEEQSDLWGLAYAASRLDAVAEQVVRAEEPAHLARWCLALAQKFNGVYHRYPIKNEPDPDRKALRLFVVQLFRRQFGRALALMGIPVPERM